MRTKLRPLLARRGREGKEEPQSAWRPSVCD